MASNLQESARGAVDIAKEFFPKVECKWGDAGIDDIIQDASINAVLVVLAAQFQAYISLLFLCVCHYFSLIGISCYTMVII